MTRRDLSKEPDDALDELILAARADLEASLEHELKEFGPDFAAVGPRLRARAEALPLATAAIDLAVSVSAIRHVGDRGAALAELRRVVRPGGAAWLVELDPAASRARIRAHAEGLGNRWLTLAFGSAIACTLAFYSLRLVINSHEFNDISQGVDATPLWIPQIGMAVGTVMLAIAFLDDLLLMSLGHPVARLAKHSQEPAHME